MGFYVSGASRASTYRKIKGGKTREKRRQTSAFRFMCGKRRRPHPRRHGIANKKQQILCQSRFSLPKSAFFTVTCRAAVALIYTVTVHQITRRAAHVWREMETSKIKKSAPDAELETREACDWLGTRDPCGFGAKVPFFSRKRSSCVRWSGGGPG